GGASRILRGGKVFYGVIYLAAFGRPVHRIGQTRAKMLSFNAVGLSWRLGQAATIPRDVSVPEAEKQPPQEFPTTRWTLLRQAIADGTTVRAVALEELVLRYRPPLRAHLVLRK